MAIITDIKDAELLIGTKVKCKAQDRAGMMGPMGPMPGIPPTTAAVTNLSDIVPGEVIKVESSWEYTKDGDVCLSFIIVVEVEDRVAGRIYQIRTNDVYTEDIKEADIIAADIDKEIAVQEAIITEHETKIAELVSAKTAIGIKAEAAVGGLGDEIKP